MACLAASLVNPYTYHLHVHMVAVSARSVDSQHIMEFFSLSFHHPTAIFFESDAGAGGGWRPSGTCGRAALPSRCCCWCGRTAGLLAARNIPIFMIAAAPPVAAAVQQWLLTCCRS